MIARDLAPLLERAVGAATRAGRPLFAANAALPLLGDTVERMWQAATTLREHRGDGHVTALTAAGVGGLAAHVLIARDTGTPDEVFRDNRGWSADEWAAAVADLERRGLLDGERLTDAGHRLRAEVEAATDRAAAGPYAALTDSDRDRLIGLAAGARRAILATGLVPHPNPMGLPEPAD